jgi:tetratricopeptide (TPR) repeat protein
MRAYTVKPPDGPYGAAFTALAKKDYVLAKERFRHALSQSEGDPDLWVGSARTHLALGENEAALGDATKLVSADPANVAGWVLKGDCHQALKQPREALAAFAAALRLDPDDVTARQGAAAAQGALSIISR